MSAAAARLCGLLLLALAAATGCAPAPGQAAGRAIERLGGKAVFAPPAGDAPAALRRIDLAHTQVSDADLVRLARKWGGAAGPLATVEELDLTHTAVGDEAVAALPEFPALRKLSLTLTRVSDGGLAPLARLDRLAELYLADTPVTDAAVATLEKLAHLRTLVLLRTEVSDVAAARLRRALPDALVQAPARSAPGPRRDNAGRRP